jgi:hypothetical protein
MRRRNREGEPHTESWLSRRARNDARAPGARAGLRLFGKRNEDKVILALLLVSGATPVT